LLFVPLNFRTKTGEKSTLMAVQFLGTIIIESFNRKGKMEYKSLLVFELNRIRGFGIGLHIGA
ncbi:hypothetical protein JXA32_17640, partial [Candidatus Sumerlaeota bacterium]|nr:hypothetical protein [Candidatus Sumerlaeota bacterium]